MAERNKKKTSSSRTGAQTERKSVAKPNSGKAAQSPKASSAKKSSLSSKASNPSKAKASPGVKGETKTPARTAGKTGAKTSKPKSTAAEPRVAVKKSSADSNMTKARLAGQSTGSSQDDLRKKVEPKSKASQVESSDRRGKEKKGKKVETPSHDLGTARQKGSRRLGAEDSQQRHPQDARTPRVGAEGKPSTQKSRPPKELLTVVDAADDESEDTLRHPLSEIIAVTDSQSVGPEETIERDGRIVARDFGILDLHEGIRQALKSVGYTKPTEVQALCLPHTLEGKDVAGFAQTGTGKTAVFLITAGHRILSEQIRSGDKGSPAVLVLVPTRELAAQIETEAASLFKDLNISTMAVYGGSADIDKQTKALSKRVDLVVATPGRLFDLHRQGVLHLNSVGLLVCDEADRMLDMGFIEDVEKVLSLVSETAQKMLFSATGSTKVHELAFEYLNEPEYIETTPEQIMPERITQWCYAAKAEEKFSVLLASLKEENPTCAIVFTNTKVVAEWVGYKLAANGIEAEALTGDLPQNRRLTLIKKIKNGELKVLVATDVLSRGLHVTGLSHVYNFDVPDEPESFIHRIGRTARAGEKGTAITLVCEDYGYNMGAVEDLLGFSVPLKPIKEAFLKIEDRSDFPFDSTGRVKTTRGLREGDRSTAESEVAPSMHDKAGRVESPHRGQRTEDTAARGRDADNARQQQRDSANVGDQRRPSRDMSPDERWQSPRDDRPQRSREERLDRPRDDRNDRPREERFDRPRDDRNDRPREERFDRSRDDRIDRPREERFDRPRDDRNDRPREERFDRPRDDKGARVSFERDDKQSDLPRREASGRYDERARPARDQESRYASRERSDANQTEQSFQSSAGEGGYANNRDFRSRESKFVRRDERAKEVIEAALLAAARERELQRSASMVTEGGRGVADTLARVPGAEVAKVAAERLGESLLKTIRRAAPNLGGLLRKLSDLLEPEPSVVQKADSPEVHTFEREKSARGRDDRGEFSQRYRGEVTEPRVQRMDPDESRQDSPQHALHSRRPRRDEAPEAPSRYDSEVVLDRNGRPARDEAEENRRSEGGRDGRRPSRDRGDHRSRGNNGRDGRHSPDGRRRNP